MLPRIIIVPLITTCIDARLLLSRQGPYQTFRIHPGIEKRTIVSTIEKSRLVAFATTNSRHKQRTTFNCIDKNIVMTEEEAKTVSRCTIDDGGGVIQKLRSLTMEKKEPKRHASMRRASILIPLFERDHHHPSGSNYSKKDNINDTVGADDDPDAVSSSSSVLLSSNLHVLFTQRVSNMTSHGGEVCFPGGRQDEGDGQDDVETALRETFEEVGIEREYIECIARMNSVESKHSLCVTPIIGLIHPPTKAEPSRLQLNAEEVEVAFAVPLHYFANPSNCYSIDKYKWKGGDVLIRTYMYDDPESGRRFKIWGLTAHVIHSVAQLAFESSKVIRDNN